MADTNVQSNSVPALALELEKLQERVRKMESLLSAAETILSTIRYDGDLCTKPANGDPEAHYRAYKLITFLQEQLEAWKQSEADLDFASDDIFELMDKAQHGKLLRYGESVLEQAA